MGLLLGLGTELLKLEQPAKAIEPLRKALAIAREVGRPDAEAAALQGLALANEKLALAPWA